MKLQLIKEMKVIKFQYETAIEALEEERQKYDELNAICRAQHEAICQCSHHLHEATLALLAFVDAKIDIYAESKKRAKQKKADGNNHD